MKISPKRVRQNVFVLNFKRCVSVLFFAMTLITYGQSKEGIKNDAKAKENKRLDSLMQQLNAASLKENKTNYAFNVLTNRQNSSFNLINSSC